MRGGALACPLVHRSGDAHADRGQTALTALQALAGPRGREAAGVLRYLCLLHGQRETPEVLERWIARREGGAAPAG